MPMDKFIHLAAGVLIGLLAAPVAEHFGLSPAISAATAATAIGIAKELYDAAGYGDPDPWDAAATAAGGALIGLTITF